jgi:hypothetical protein
MLKLVDLVCVVYLVDLVHLNSLVQPNKLDKPNNGLLTLEENFTILPRETDYRNRFFHLSMNEGGL